MTRLDRLDLSRSRGGTAAERLSAAAARAHAQAHLGAFITVVDADSTDPGHPEGVLAGVPVAVKDNLDTADLPTTGGTPALHESQPGRDHHAVAMLREAGATVVGKTNLHELAFGITGNNAAYGPARNPHDQDRVAGGSSGGSAIAVATGVTAVALGTDTGGSLRVPASFCGVVGFRPTTGRWGSDRAVPLSATRDTAGALATTVADVVLLDQVVTGDGPATVPTARALRLGVPLPGFFDGLHPEVSDRVGQALDRLADAGVELVEVDVANGHELDARCGFPIVFHEVVRELPRYLASLPDGAPTLEGLLAQVASPDVRGALEHALGTPVPGDVHAECLQLRDQLREAYGRALTTPDGGRLDALVYPTVPLPAPPVGDDLTTDLAGRDVPVFATVVQNTAPGSTAGMPALSLPCGTTTTGLPVGLSLESLPGADGALLAAARRVEQLLS